jgi:ABC-2 type transport system ATP-binding protein
MIIPQHLLGRDMTTTPDAVPDERTGQSPADHGSANAGGSALVVRNLKKTFGSGEDAVRAVDGVSLAVDSGTVVGLLGPNGAGKTTLIKSVLGLVVPDAGEVRLAGVDPHADTREAYRHVGAMLEGARNVYWKLTVRENLEFFAAVGGESPAALRERHDALLEQLSLAGKADTPVNDLSRGQKQKVSLACALARDADVAFLDEPTLGLDVESSVELRREIRRLADQEEMTVLLSSHDMDVVQDVCDRVVIVNDGRVIADDTVENLIDVFRTHAYRVVVDDALATATRDRLRERYGVGDVESTGDRAAFEVALGDPERFYDLMDELRAADHTVVAVESVDPDLEEVFLEITGEDAASAREGTGLSGGGDDR